MRISNNQTFLTNLRGLQAQQSQMLHTQAQLVSGRKLLSAADDPFGAQRVVDLGQSISAIDQLQRNAAAAQTGLTLSEQVLGDMHAVLLGVRETIVDSFAAANGVQDFRNFAADIGEKLDQLFALANSRDGNGEYLFAGSTTGTQPFLNPAEGSYPWQGDQQARAVKVGPTRSLEIYPSGFELLADVPTGDGRVAGLSDPGNAGDGLLGPVTSADGSYNGDDYEVLFTAPDRLDIVNTTTGSVLATAQPFAPGNTLNFAGIALTIEGQPAAGDRFGVGPARGQNALEAIGALQASLANATPEGNTGLFNDLNRGLERLDRVLERVELSRTRAGNRLAALDDIRSANDTFALRFREQLSELQDLDFTEAAARLSQQARALEIAQAAFARVQNLSLFNFI